MDYCYDIQDLSRICKISKTTVYAFIRKNQDFVSANSSKVKNDKDKTKPKTKYNQAVLDLLLSQYGESDNEEDRDTLKTKTVEEDAAPPKAPQATQPTETPTEATETILEGKEGETPTQEKINALQATIDALQAKLEAAEAERRDLISQNGNLLLLLNQEKAEKQQLLLPSPRKSIGERLKALFRK